ncbi:TOPRIM nucleotidyl transferase/hydrolase domain-containing protein [Streptomyces sp. NPDC005438]|uniref:TOPRIM nucleotidyl transferase/hydrolase domain-containing protein n=1 Tax=Streptomyces sp. NPDC005438 TaxID=3156880 RepID=UPI0033BA6E59
MNELTRFREAAVTAAAGGADAREAADTARELVSELGVRTVVLVEGESDRVALDTLAGRQGRSLDAERVPVVPLGGATSIGRFLDLCGPQGLDLGLAGLCDIGEERHFRRALERAGVASELTPEGLESLGFFVCVADLEDELIRALGTGTVERVLQLGGDLRRFRTFQKQPAQRGRPVEDQLHRFMGTHSGRKALYARLLVEALGPEQVPRPLDELLAHV